MYHDARTYIELRYDGDSADVVIVNFRDRGILPTEVKSWEYTIDSPILSSDLTEELRFLVNSLWLAIYHDK